MQKPPMSRYRDLLDQYNQLGKRILFLSDDHFKIGQKQKNAQQFKKWKMTP